jgi:hypothetical protein
VLYSLYSLCSLYSLYSLFSLFSLYLPNGDSFSGIWESGKLASQVQYTFHTESNWNNPDF